MNPLSPKTLRGALVSFKLPVPVPSVIAFQYNPASLQRTLETRTSGGGEGAGEEAFRISGAPNESIKLELELDGADSDVDDATGGVSAKLAALEMLITPDTGVVIANSILAQMGTIELIPAQAPFTLFVFGSGRIVPVRITEFSVTEEEFEPGLSPYRAKISLGLKVLSYSDLPVTHPGHHIYLAHQVAKEARARIGSIQSLDAILGSGAKIL